MPSPFCAIKFSSNYFSSVEYLPPETLSNAICLHLHSSSTALWAAYFLGLLWHCQSQFESKNQIFVFSDKCPSSANTWIYTQLFCWIRTHNPTSYCSTWVQNCAEFCWNSTGFSLRALLIQEKWSLLSSSHSKSVIQLPLWKYITLLCILTL